MAVTQHIVDTLPANGSDLCCAGETKIGRILASSGLRSAQSDNPGSVENLRQLSQLKREPSAAAR